jgi:agmatine deiminase
MPLPKTMIYKMGPGDSVYDYISSLDYQDGSKFPVGDSVNVVAAGSYLNFTITNKVVLGQKFWREGLDDEIKKRDLEVEQLLQSLFPNRKVVMIDATAVNLGGGGIHCITMHQPIKPNELQ